MSLHRPVERRTARARVGTGRTLAGALVCTVGLTSAVAAVGPGVGPAGATGSSGGAGVSLLSPDLAKTVDGVAVAGYTDPTARGHTYRHGAVPRIVASGPAAAPTTRPYLTSPPVGSPATPAARLNTAGGRASAPASGRLLAYGGGLTAQGAGAVGSLVRAGVTTGQPKLYLVFLGSQWGTEGTNGTGQATFTGDPQGEAPLLQTLYAGLGTNAELWSGIVTQYCDGVPVGATSCASGGSNIPYPTGNVLAGVWYDSGAAATAAATAGATGNQLAAEAEAAAIHFGNLDQTSNRNTQYVIASPTGSNADGWSNPTTGYCAYHDDTHDPTIDGGGPVAGPILAFTNLPYVADAGYACGAGLVNTPGTLDGVGEAASHEFGETLTDQFPETTPPGGWSTSAGAEIGDLCAYISAPSPGAAYNLTLATGTVVVQGLWSNAAGGGKGGCIQGSPVFTYSPVVTSFAPAKATAGTSVIISGAVLGGATSVTFNGVPAAITSDVATQLVVTVPPGATSGTISVTTPQGTATSTKKFVVIPSITGFSPASGPPGTSLTVTGTGLSGATKVDVGGKPSSILSDVPQQLVVVVPTKAKSGPIIVKTAGGKAISTTSFVVT